MYASLRDNRFILQLVEVQITLEHTLLLLLIVLILLKIPVLMEAKILDFVLRYIYIYSTYNGMVDEIIILRYLHPDAYDNIEEDRIPDEDVLCIMLKKTKRQGVSFIFQ